jgi:arsenical pump membrane protein
MPRLTSWLPVGVGSAAAVVAAALAPAAARSAAAQVYAPFVLVVGLILIGLVADGDGLFAHVGHRLALLAPNGTALFVGAAALTAGVTAVLNLDTAVVFLTPVLVHAARSRDADPTPHVVGCLLLANAGSLLLPGSNLTNLIVLGHLHRTGSQFLHRMALPWVASVLVTTAVIRVLERRRLASSGPVGDPPERAVVGIGLAAIVAATALVLLLRSPAVPVAAVGFVAVAIRLATRELDPGRSIGVLGVPVLVALFGLAVALGTLGRRWSGPTTLLGHVGAAGTVAVGAVASILVNNLPAASLLAARAPPHPFALLIGLDVGPNLFVTGSLAWVLWWRTTRQLGAEPPTSRAIVLGLVSAPLAMAAALALVSVTGSS